MGDEDVFKELLSLLESEFLICVCVVVCSPMGVNWNHLLDNCRPGTAEVLLPRSAFWSRTPMHFSFSQLFASDEHCVGGQHSHSTEKGYNTVNCAYDCECNSSFLSSNGIPAHIVYCLAHYLPHYCTGG